MVALPGCMLLWTHYSSIPLTGPTASQRLRAQWSRSHLATRISQGAAYLESRTAACPTRRRFGPQRRARACSVAWEPTSTAPDRCGRHPTAAPDACASAQSFRPAWHMGVRQRDSLKARGRLHSRHLTQAQSQKTAGKPSNTPWYDRVPRFAPHLLAPRASSEAGSVHIVGLLDRFGYQRAAVSWKLPAAARASSTGLRRGRLGGRATPKR